MTKITKVDFDNLPDILKAKFKAEGEEFILIEEDVEGLKKNAADLLKEKKALEKLFEGVDPEKAKAAIAAAAKLEEDGLAAKGEYDALKAKLEERHATELKIANERADTIIGKLRAEKIANLAVSKGVKADRIKAAIAEGDLDSIFDLDETDFSVKKKDGIGDAKEVDDFFTGLKTSKPYLFEAGNTQGGGAAGSDTTGGTGTKSATKAEVAAMNATEKHKFYTEGGEVTDRT